MLKWAKRGGKYMAAILLGPTGRRITGLREREDMTLDELAARIGINATTLGRMEKGQTQKIGSDVLAALAREFNVSADYLLGLTDIPDRKNYAVSELGLSAQAVRNLYTQKVNPDVVNRLLVHPRFALLTAMIAQYLDDTFAAGITAQNQLFSSMSDILLGVGRNDPEQKVAAKEAAHAINLSKVPPHQVELTKSQNTFMAMLKEMKRDTASDLEPARTATVEVIETMMTELTKGQDVPLTSITPEQIVEAIIQTAGVARPAPEGLTALRGGLLSVFETLPRANDTHEQ